VDKKVLQNLTRNRFSKPSVAGNVLPIAVIVFNRKPTLAINLQSFDDTDTFFFTKCAMQSIISVSANVDEARQWMFSNAIQGNILKISRALAVNSG